MFGASFYTAAKGHIPLPSNYCLARKISLTEENITFLSYDANISITRERKAFSTVYWSWTPGSEMQAYSEKHAQILLYMGVTMIIGDDSFVVICDQYYIFQRSLKPKWGRLPHFYFIGVMEKIIKQIILLDPRRISSLPCLLAKSPSLPSTLVPLHTLGYLLWKAPKSCW